jgi:hypothetical protein
MRKTFLASTGFRTGFKYVGVNKERTRNPENTKTANNKQLEILLVPD